MGVVFHLAFSSVVIGWLFVASKLCATHINKQTTANNDLILRAITEFVSLIQNISGISPQKIGMQIVQRLLFVHLFANIAKSKFSYWQNNTNSLRSMHFSTKIYNVTKCSLTFNKFTIYSKNKIINFSRWLIHAADQQILYTSFFPLPDKIVVVAPTYINYTMLVCLPYDRAK